MHILLLALALVSPISFAAEQAFSLQCSTDEPTTAFGLTLDGDQYLLRVRHFNGVEFMPIHEGVIVPHDLPLLRDEAQMLEKMGDYAEFHFPRANCKVYGKGQLSCGDGEKKKFGDTTMQAVGFDTTTVHESAFGQEFDSYKITLSIWVQDFVPVIDMTMNYSSRNCKLGGF
jgi:hypothetical protein